MAVTQRSSTVAVYAVLHLPPLYPLSLQYSADHRDLHSFPTRRSSDLPGRSRPGERARLAPRTGQCREQSRSEEHTSELQSHSDIVCRLLLEKKKIALAKGLSPKGVRTPFATLGPASTPHRPASCLALI